MKVESNAVMTRMNRTMRYLLPCVIAYGPEFLSKFNSILKMAVGINDYDLMMSGINLKNNLFVLVHTKVPTPTLFLNTLKWFREQEEFYEYDYPYDNLVKGNLHMLVIKVPEKHLASLKYFMKGQYSKMYTPEEVMAYFPANSDESRIFNPDPESKKKFASAINRKFDTDYSVEDFEQESLLEIDFPFQPEEEIFNYPDY